MDKNKFWLGGRLFNTASRHVRKLGGPTHVRNATQGTSATQTQGTSANANANARHVRNANARHVRTSASWAPQRNARHVRKMVAQTQNSSAMETSTQGSTRLKDELEDG
jgi:hypothetical protein